MVALDHCLLRALVAAGSVVACVAIWTSADAAGAEGSSAPGEVTFSKHIAPILWKNCAGCHRAGEIGPFSLLTYDEAQKRAEFLAEITADRRMPPWKAEPGVGKFRDERRLTEAEIELIGKWAAAGAPEGNPRDLPRPPKFTDGWQLGEPDMIVKMAEPFAVPAGGKDIYRCFVIPLPIEKDMMVSAVEFRPGNRRVVHHSIMFLDAAGEASKLAGKDGQPGYESFGGPGVAATGGLGAWVPGMMPRLLPDGFGKFVKQGSDLVLQVHYHPTGKPEQDQSAVGIYFCKKPVTRVISGIAIVQPDLKIPAGRRYHSVQAESEPLPADVHVLGLTPHMHYLGREIKVTAVDPTGTKTAPLIWIKDWDFNWQGSYQFVRPIRLPKGSTIKVQAYYDNSTHNPKNPNYPPKEVSWGIGTDDEMCLVSVQIFANTPDDLREIAKMPYHELAAGIEGGAPGEAALAKGAAPDKAKVASQAKPMPAADGSPPAEPDPNTVAAKEDADKKPEKADKKPEKKDTVAAAKMPKGGYPIPSRMQPLFKQWDKNGDGRMSQEEIDALPEALREVTVERLQEAYAKSQE